MISESMIQKGRYQYYQAKPENEIDLVMVVRDMLSKKGIAHVLPSTYDIHPYIVQAHGKNLQTQRFLLNRYWNLQLLAAAQDSVDARFALIPNGSVENYLNLFENKVVPFLLDNNLPIPL